MIVVCDRNAQRRRLVVAAFCTGATGIDSAARLVHGGEGAPVCALIDEGERGCALAIKRANPGSAVIALSDAPTQDGLDLAGRAFCDGYAARDDAEGLRALVQDVLTRVRQARGHGGTEGDQLRASH